MYRIELLGIQKKHVYLSHKLWDHACVKLFKLSVQFQYFGAVKDTLAVTVSGQI